MSVAVRVILICCLLQGIICQDWSASLPPTIKALSGSCVIIPCSFRIPLMWESSLDDSCKAIWLRAQDRLNVFDSSLTGPDANINILQGNLTGSLLHKDCTTIFYNLPSNHNVQYNFRLECDNSLKFIFQDTVLMTTRENLPKPTLTPPRLEVEEGTSVTLSCAAVAPCPTQLPALTWTPGLGDSETVKLEANVVTSVLNFTASPLHHRQKISCTALYSRPAGFSDRSFKSSLTINVHYPPKNTSVSPIGVVVEGSSVTLICSSIASPAVESYTWYRVNGDQVTSVGIRQNLRTTVSVDNRQFYCAARNIYGIQKSSVIEINVQFPPRNTVVSVDPSGPLLEGGSVTLTCNSTAYPEVQNYTWYRANGDGGDMLESGPTFTIDSADLSHNGEYYCVATNDHGEEKAAAVQLDIHYPPKNTSVSVSPTGSVTEGSSVTLSCSSVANPVENYTWYRADGGGREAVGFDKNFTFNVMKLSTDEYYCEAWNDHGRELSEPISINATFAPEILRSSHCIRIMSRIRCSCESHGNPPPSLVWELAGQPVSHIPIREVLMGKTGLQSIITLHHPDELTATLVCLSTNPEGSDSLVFNVSSIENQQGFEGFHSISLWIGFAAGAVGMMLLFALLQLIVFMKRKGSLSSNVGLEEMTEANAVISTNEEAIYANKAMLEVDVAMEGDTLHYANVDFAKLQAKSDGTQGEGEIRGLASKTAEYAEIRLQSGGSTGGEAEATDAASGRRDTDVHGPVEQIVGNGGELTVETKDSGHP